GLRGSKKLKPGALCLYVDDGHCAAVEAIGTYHLELPIGLVIVLNNCHYAPSIIRGVISVSRLFDDGFINRFDDNNVISVSKNNLVYFMVVSWNGIFAIDMSCSNTNDSSMSAITNKRAKLNLDSSLLWHCRLGHISKKHIKQLQHDGLLNSSDIESLGNRYGYVYLMKHKHEVFETFKVFQMEVENQLEKTIKSLRSDRGDTSLNHEEDDQEIDEPQSDINPIRKSSRTRRALDRMCLYIDAKEHDKRLFKKKTDMDGDVYIFKARLVAKGFTQTYGVDYEETFSPVADIRAIRILIAIAASYDYEIWTMNVKTAFLTGHLSKEVYMEQPEGFVNPKYPNHICKLNRSIYGLKQASRQWNKRFDDEIKKFGFTQNPDEPYVYLKSNVKSYLGRSFAMKDLGDVAYILGIKIYRDRSKRLIGLCQKAYIEKILKRYYMENSKRGTIPMQEKLKLSKSQGASTPAEKQRMQNISYASAVGSIMYVVRCTRPDVAFAQNVTSRFQQNPGEEYWIVVKNIIKYLRNTKDMFLVYGDVEYITAFDASKEAVWIRKFIFGLGIVLTIKEPISMYCDNTGAIEIAKDDESLKVQDIFT
nr:hypothetical protein [Tanacetum cinerariifolium]